MHYLNLKFQINDDTYYTILYAIESFIETNKPSHGRCNDFMSNLTYKIYSTQTKTRAFVHFSNVIDDKYDLQ